MLNVSLNVHQVVKVAKSVASSNGVSPMPVHLLLGCAQIPAQASRFLNEIGITVDKVSQIRKVQETDQTVDEILVRAGEISKLFKQNAIVSEAVLYVLSAEIAQTVEVINRIAGEGASVKLAKSILNKANAEPALLAQSRGVRQSDVAIHNDVDEDGTIPKDIMRLGIDLTEQARIGKIDAIIGRDDETQRVVEILCRKTKNNPVLIGEAGVGKTSIVEGLALRIVNGDVPELLQGKTIFSLDMGSLMAGTKFRGELEQRLEQLLKLIADRQDIILFIDEIHTITTATGKEGEIGISEMLKPKLARGQMQTIGATTTEEYRKFIEKDAALERRFAPIIVNPPTTGQCIEILQGLRGSYESFHGVDIGQDAIVAAVTLSDRYITERNLPDKAIDVLDEACSRAKIASKVRAQINADSIADVVSQMTGVPVSKLTSDEKTKLQTLEEDLKKNIIGQDAAIASIAKAVRRARAGVADANRPVGSFMFLGRTGVGKTEVTKQLASMLFTNEKALVKLDMSEFSESHSVSKLIGSPPGYAGYDDASAVCERVRRNPYCIVLFDEIEKAHPDVYNVMLQILDEGRLTDNKGKTTSFKNAIIIMTSNVGVENISNRKSIGFTGGDAGASEEEAMMAGLKKRFKPEFINRIDSVIVFNSLKKQDIKKIARVKIESLAKKLTGVGVELTVTEGVIDWLVENGYQEEYGVRPLRRLIQNSIEDQIAEQILKADTHSVTVSVKEGKLSFAY